MNSWVGNSIHRSAHRRGSVFVATLGASILLTVIGLAALATARIEVRKRQIKNDSVAARKLAESGVELGLLTVQGDPNFRNTYVHDIWQPDQTLGDGTIRWKLLDGVDDASSDGDLMDDPNDAVRVVAWGLSGKATQKCSVVFQPTILTANLLTNGDIENGTGSWYVGGTADIEASASNPHNGTSSLRIFNRANYWSLPAQNIDGFIQNGASYDISTWVRLEGSTQNVTPQIVINSSGDGWRTFKTSYTLCSSGVWTPVTSSITPTWSGDLLHASIRVGTQTSHPFQIDDISLEPQGGGGGSVQLNITSGSWRKVVN